MSLFEFLRHGQERFHRVAQFEQTHFLPLANATRTSVQARALFDTRLWVSLALLMGTNILLYCELALDRWNSLLVWTFISEWIDVVRCAPFVSGSLIIRAVPIANYLELRITPSQPPHVRNLTRCSRFDNCIVS